MMTRSTLSLTQYDVLSESCNGELKDNVEETKDEETENKMTRYEE